MADSEYLVVEAVLASSQEEPLAELVGAHSALGAHLTPVGADRMRATVYFGSECASDAEEMLAACEELGGEALTVNVEPEEDWLAEYRAHARPFAVGKTWWIEPNPTPGEPAPDGRRRLIVEPRMAFGTGSHESTHLVLLELEDEPPAGDRFLDIGCGSGILALAAQRLGAAWTLGLDIDLQAVFVARQIAADQDFSCDARYLGGPVFALGDGSFDTVACNMVTAHFMPLVGEIRRMLAPTGTVIFSGILQSEEIEVREFLEKRRLLVLSARYLGDWVSLKATHG